MPIFYCPVPPEAEWTIIARQKRIMISVNRETCIGCGSCAAQCPQSFDMDGEGKAIVISQEILECTKQAAEICPVQAIKVE
jgi:ferredoxin